MPKTGRDRDVDMFVRLVGIVTWQEPDRQPARGPGAASRVLHDAGEPAADKHGVTLRNAVAQLEGQIREWRPGV